jgi:hypothetical protein
MKRAIIPAAVTAAGLLLSLGGAVHATSGGAGAARPTASYHGAVPAAGDQPEATARSGDMPVDVVRGSIHSLTQARTSADAVESGIAGSPILRDDAVDLNSARRVRASTWIAASSSGDAVCLVAPGELSCPPASEIAARGVSVAEFWHADTPVRVTGIALDSVKAVTVVTNDGSAVTIPVVANSFAYESERAPQAVRWTGPRGSEEQALTEIPGRS